MVELCGSTLMRKKNISFFLLLPREKTIKEAAKKAGIGRQHGTRLIKKWRDCGLVAKTGLHGTRYEYTEKGEEVRRGVVATGWFG